MFGFPNQQKNLSNSHIFFQANIWILDNRIYKYKLSSCEIKAWKEFENFGPERSGLVFSGFNFTTA